MKAFKAEIRGRPKYNWQDYRLLNLHVSIYVCVLYIFNVTIHLYPIKIYPLEESMVFLRTYMP